MAGRIETKIIMEIKERFSNKFDVTSTVGKNATMLPEDRMRHVKKGIYNPDVLLRDKKTGNIRYIVEIETDPVRKALVGAAITADYVMGKRGKKSKLMFIIGDKGLSQLKNFRERLPIIRQYVRNLSVDIGTKKEIFAKIK